MIYATPFYNLFPFVLKREELETENELPSWQEIPPHPDIDIHLTNALKSDTQDKIKNLFLKIRQFPGELLFQKASSCNYMGTLLEDVRTRLSSLPDKNNPDYVEKRNKLDSNWRLACSELEKMQRDVNYGLQKIAHDNEDWNRGVRLRNVERKERSLPREAFYRVVKCSLSFSLFIQENLRVLVPVMLISQLAFSNLESTNNQNADQGVLEKTWNQIKVVQDFPQMFFWNLVGTRMVETILNKLKVRDYGPMANFLRTHPAQPTVEEERPIIFRKAVKWVSSMCYAEVAEEIRYRFIIQNALTFLGAARGCNSEQANFYARLGTSFVFGLNHSLQHLSQAIGSFAMGYFVYGKAYQDHGFIAATLLHVVNNRVSKFI